MGVGIYYALGGKIVNPCFQIILIIFRMVATVAYQQPYEKTDVRKSRQYVVLCVCLTRGYTDGILVKLQEEYDGRKELGRRFPNAPRWMLKIDWPDNYFLTEFFRRPSLQNAVPSNIFYPTCGKKNRLSIFLNRSTLAAHWINRYLLDSWTKERYK